ncbi:uncharacterized protein B0H18DRAFT_1080218 [Fomitopsis serialis]|uniref:uncharacterized protein n=1 Tax=Fomitopsis serialis TaxID=139415 RepID=UPI002008277A|nr:uncharacterized protein B0H18DRAFT_1080218 [Neoantrodia serialis]KAH9905525.1 hypothetical protein B0H18DRAFT_1080218 [Neoantrodia serialis]
MSTASIYSACVWTDEDTTYRRPASNTNRHDRKHSGERGKLGERIRVRPALCSPGPTWAVYRVAYQAGEVVHTFSVHGDVQTAPVHCIWGTHCTSSTSANIPPRRRAMWYFSHVYVCALPSLVLSRRHDIMPSGDATVDAVRRERPRPDVSSPGDRRVALRCKSDTVDTYTIERVPASRAWGVRHNNGVRVKCRRRLDCRTMEGTLGTTGPRRARGCRRSPGHASTGKDTTDVLPTSSAVAEMRRDGCREAKRGNVDCHGVGMPNAMR